LLGQELKPKKRGSGVDCSTVARQVFRHSVKRAGECMREECKRRCLGNDPILYKAFHKSLAECVSSTAVHVDRRRKALGKRQLTRLVHEPSAHGGPGRKAGTVRGYDIFMSQNYDNAAALGDHGFDRFNSGKQKWHDLTDAQRDLYKQAAEQRNAAASQAEEDFPEFYRRHPVAKNTTRRNRALITSQKRKSLRATIEKMIKHRIFNSGSQLHEFDAGFKSDLVRDDLSRAAVKSHLDRTFKYDHIPIANPATMSFFNPCKQRKGGCSTDDFFDAADTMTYNLYQCCREWKSELPVLLRFSADELGLSVFVGKLVASGPLIFFSLANVVSDAVGTRRAELVQTLDPSSKTPKSTIHTSIRAFTDFLSRWQHEQSHDYSQLESVLMQRWNFRRDLDADKFRVILGDEHSSSILQCREKVASAKPKNVEESECMFPMRQPSSSASKASWVTVGKSRQSRTVGTARGPRSLLHHREVVGRHEDDNGDRSSSSSDHANADADDSDNEQPDRLSNSEDGGSAAGDEEDAEAEPEPEAEAPEPWNAIGIKCWDLSGKGGRAKCCICGDAFPSDSTRLDFRFKMSNSLRDQKRLHPRCVNSLPRDSRARDIKVVQGWLVDHETPAEVKVELRLALDLLDAT
jgi:hypothetical protein